jgi:hypothetical protein
MGLALADERASMTAITHVFHAMVTDVAETKVDGLMLQLNKIWKVDKCVIENRRGD